MKKKGNKDLEYVTCKDCIYWIKEACDKNWETTEQGEICDEDYEPLFNNMKEMKSLYYALKKVDLKDMIAAVVKLNNTDKIQLISALKQSIKIQKVNPGQILKIIDDNGDERYGCVLGGGQTIKMYLFGDSTTSYWSIAYISYTTDTLRVIKKGKYRWPVSELTDKFSYNQNQIIINKYSK